MSRIEETIVSETPGPPFVVFGMVRCEMPKSLDEGVEQAALKLENPHIRSAKWVDETTDFPVQGEKDVGLALVRFENSIAIEGPTGVKARLEQYNIWAKAQKPPQPTYALANLKHLTAYLRARKGDFPSEVVAAAGTSADLKGYKHVPMVDTWGADERWLKILWTETNLNPRTAFLLVRTS